MKIEIKETPSFQPFDFVIKVESTTEAAGLLATFNASNNRLQENCPNKQIDEYYNIKDLLAAYLKTEYTHKLYCTLLDHLLPSR